MDSATASPSFVLPPLPPGSAWAWNGREWTPIPYAGPTWAPPSSPPASSPPAAPLDPLLEAEHAEHSARAQLFEAVRRYVPAPTDEAARVEWMGAIAEHDEAARDAMVAFAHAHRSAEAARAERAASSTPSPAAAPMTSTANTTNTAAASRPMTSTANTTNTAAASQPITSPAAPEVQSLFALARRDREVAVPLVAYFVANERAQRAQEQCARALAALGLQFADPTELVATTRALASFDPDIAAALHAWEEAEHTANAALAATCAAIRKSVRSTPSSTAMSPTAAAPAASCTASATSATTAEATRAQLEASSTSMAAERASATTGAPQEATAIAAQWESVLALAQRDRDVAVPLVTWIEASNGAQRAQEQCAHALAALGLQFSNPAELAATAHTLASFEPDIAAALHAWEEAKRTAVAAVAATCAAIRKSTRSTRNTTAITSTSAAAPVASSTTSAMSATTAEAARPQPEASNIASTAAEPASPTTAAPSDEAHTADLLADLPPWIAPLADQDAHVAIALGDLHAARAAELAAGHLAADVITRYGPGPADHAQSVEWVADLATTRPDVAEALRTCAATAAAVAHATAALSRAVAPHTPSEHSAAATAATCAASPTAPPAPRL